MSAASRLQEDLNREVYSARGVYRFYLTNELTPSESACLAKYRPHIAGRDVLDIGVGAGRTARYLAPLARRYEAVDYSPVMVAYLKKTMPHIRVHPADFSDMTGLDDRSFDFVFAPNNVIDALSHEHRQRALKECSRLLREGGILAFSCHNLGYRRALSRPSLDLSSQPLRLAKNVVKYVLSWRNHLRVGRLRQVTPEYALLNDPGHFYACLHYYATRSTVRKQLAGSGLRFIEVFDPAGRVLAETDDDSDHSSLLYVAQVSALQGRD